MCMWIIRSIWDVNDGFDIACDDLLTFLYPRQQYRINDYVAIFYIGPNNSSFLLGTKLS